MNLLDRIVKICREKKSSLLKSGITLALILIWGLVILVCSTVLEGAKHHKIIEKILISGAVSSLVFLLTYFTIDERLQEKTGGVE